MRPPCMQLVGIGKLIKRDLILIRMPRPGAIHQAIGFILFVFGENFQRTRVQLRVFAAGIQRCHAADCQHSSFVADLRHQLAQILEERHVVWNCVAVREHPVRIVQVEVNQAGHVIPAAEIQAENVVAEVVEELLHLKRQRM